MKNVLMLVIDGLSKWYIDHASEDASFFHSIHKYGYSAENMFSGAPFTQGAIGNFWYGKDTLDGWNYYQENYYSGESIFDFFCSSSYEIYIGKLPPFYSNRMHESVRLVSRENPVPRAVDHLWRGRILYYLNIGVDNMSERDWRAIHYLLQSFFEIYENFSPKIKKEYEKFLANKKEYIHDVIVEGEDGNFFKSIDTSMYHNCSLKSITELKKATESELSKAELLLCRKIKLVNRRRMLEINKALYPLSSLEEVLAMPKNRCVVSNDDVSSHLRNGYENLPGIGEELEEFYEWYRKRETNTCFFSYIHNFDFHYPEVFTNCRFGDNGYDTEIHELIKRLDNIAQCPMSVSKQLALSNIDRNIEMFTSKLHNCRFFDDSILIITADHGISNFMYPVRRKAVERWNYIKTDFQIPFYVIGTRNGIIDEKLHTAKEILPMIRNMIKMEGKPSVWFPDKNPYISTSWVNGIPDLSRAKIRYGIRNLDASMTLELYLSQFLVSGNVRGLYCLKEDPDEIRNIYKEKTQSDVIQLMRLLASRWEQNLRQYILGESECNIFESSRKNLIQKHLDFIIDYNKRISFADRKAYYDSCNGKIIVCGDRQEVLDFIQSLPENVHVQRIIGNKTGQKYMFGIRYEAIATMKSVEEAGIVIASRNEIEFVAMLLEKEYRNFVLSSMLF